MKFEGLVTYVGPVEKIGENETLKQTIVLTEDSDKEYKGAVALDVWKDKTEYSSSLKLGDKIEAEINSKASEYNGKYYNRLSMWKFNKVD
jgi:LEA14-like dessication related protein